MNDTYGARHAGVGLDARAAAEALQADVDRVRALLRRAGLHVEHDGGTALTLVLAPS